MNIVDELLFYAVKIVIKLYLDIIYLFLVLLHILFLGNNQLKILNNE